MNRLKKLSNKVSRKIEPWPVFRYPCFRSAAREFFAIGGPENIKNFFGEIALRDNEIQNFEDFFSLFRAGQFRMAFVLRGLTAGKIVVLKPSIFALQILARLDLHVTRSLTRSGVGRWPLYWRQLMANWVLAHRIDDHVRATATVVPMMWWVLIGQSPLEIAQTSPAGSALK